MALRKIRFWCHPSLFFLLAIIFIGVSGFEKTLRKMVRVEKKMEVRPFSNNLGVISEYKNSSQARGLKFNNPSKVPYVQEYVRNKKQSVISPRKFSKNILTAFDIQARHTSNIAVQKIGVFPEDNIQYQPFNDSIPSDIPSENFYNIHVPASKFFDYVPAEPKQSDSENMVEFPIKNESKNKTVFVRGIYNPKADQNIDKRRFESPSTTEDDKPDFILPEDSRDTRLSVYDFNISDHIFLCNVVKETRTDLDAQEIFLQLDIEPPWMSNKNYWNSIFDSRYEVLMRNPKWPELKVFLLPRVHIDTIWKKSFEEYHNNSVRKIITNVVKKLHFYNNLTFTWNEVSHLSRWWTNTTAKLRSSFRKLNKRGRLEITTGGWVEPDEATSHLFGLVHQLVEGHQWLKDNLNVSPKVGWLTNSVTHSPTMTYLLAASGIYNLVMTNVHYSVEKYLAEYQLSDFVWVQNWDSDITSPTALNEALNKLGKDRYPRRSVFTHYLQFNSAGIRACGPKSTTCLVDYNFANMNHNQDVYSHNIYEKSEVLLEQYSKTGTISSHNVIIAPIGGPNHYESQRELDYQYNNYQKIAEFVNTNKEIYKATIEFGTPKDYFNAVQSRHKSFPSLKGDFLNFADISSGKPAYWSGYFTTRPSLKILLARLQSTMRSTEILYTFAVSFNLFRKRNAPDMAMLLKDAREIVSRLQDRNVVSGTLPAKTLRYVHDQILKTVKNCWFIQEVSVSILSTRSNINKPYLKKYIYRNGEITSVFKTVAPGDLVYVFNSLSQKRTEIVELMTRYPNIRVLDHNKKTVSIQIDPVWKYDVENYIQISRTFFKVVFAIMVPPLSLESFRIAETYDASQHAAIIYCSNCLTDKSAKDFPLFPFSIQPMGTGDVQLESYKHRLIVDENTGFLKTVVEKDTNQEKSVSIDYGAFRSSDENAGMYLFNTNVHRPLYDILMPYRIGLKSKVTMIISGQVTTELTSIYGPLLQHSIKISNLLNNPLSNAISVESRLDFELSPKNRDLEFFMSVQSGVENGNPPELFVDNNGFQYTPRKLNLSRRIESNIYPMTTMAYIEDNKSRITLITDHTQGVTALQEGQILVMLDRRILFNDGRGTEEGLADSTATSHRFYILLENFNTPTKSYQHRDLSLPSMAAIYLSNVMLYMLDIFLIDKDQSHNCHYLFLPLIQSSFPCDVSVLNYRVLFNSIGIEQTDANSALLILHKQTFCCQIDTSEVLCNGANDLSLGKILRHVKAAYVTNLVGTDQGKTLHTLKLFNFAPMELMTVRILF